MSQTFLVEGPDGLSVTFPQGTDRDTVNRVMGEAHNKHQAQLRISKEKDGSPTMFAIDDKVRGFARGVPVLGGTADEVSAGLNTGFGYFGDYDKELAYQRERDAQFDKEHPWQSAGLQLTGGIAGSLAGLRALGVPASAGKGAPLINKAATGAATGAGLGAIEGFTRGEDGFKNRLQEMGESAAFGGILGGAAPVAAKAVGPMVKGFLPKVQPPTTESIKQAKTAAYAAAEKNGDNLPAKLFSDEFASMQTQLADQFLDPALHPGTTRALKALEAFQGNDVPQAKIDQVRKFLVRVTRGSQSGDDRYMAGEAIGMLDDMMEKTPGGPLWKEAHALAKKNFKADKIDNAIERANQNAEVNLNGSGLEQGLKQQFKRIAQEKRFKRDWSQQEQDAITAVFTGTATDKMLRKMPGFGKLSTMFRIGLATQYPGLATAEAVASAAGKKALETGTLNKVALVEAIVKGGPEMLQLNLARAKSAEELARLYLTAGSGLAGEALSSRVRELQPAR